MDGTYLVAVIEANVVDQAVKDRGGLRKILI